MGVSSTVMSCHCALLAQNPLSGDGHCPALLHAAIAGVHAVRQVGHSAGWPPARLGAVPLDLAGVSAQVGQVGAGPVVR